jgi:hypothetical protein
VTTDVAMRAPAPWRMLFQKAWLETRHRFLASAALLTLLGLATVARASSTIHAWESFHAGERMPYALYVWLSLSHGYLQFLWIVAAVILGLGGLVREQGTGTAGFTLALPVRRHTWVLTRALTGAAEATVLALIPGLLVALLSPLVGHGYPMGQALSFGLLLAGGGSIFYALGLLLSHLFRSEYAAPGVGLAMAAAFYVVTKLPGLEPFNVFAVMTGSRYMEAGTYLLRGFPIGPAAAWLLVAGVLVWISNAVVARRDF